jgi:hypothetical protein
MMFATLSSTSKRPENSIESSETAGGADKSQIISEYVFINRGGRLIRLRLDKVPRGGSLSRAALSLPWSWMSREMDEFIKRHERCYCK